MALFANRVNEASSPLRITSRSCTPWARAASSAISNRRANSLRIGAPDFDLAEPGRAGAMAGAHDLFGLAFAAVRHAPQGPVFAAGDGDASVPELGGNAAVARVLEHAHAAAVANFPADLAPELKVVALV